MKKGELVIQNQIVSSNTDIHKTIFEIIKTVVPGVRISYWLRKEENNKPNFMLLLLQSFITTIIIQYNMNT